MNRRPLVVVLAAGALGVVVPLAATRWSPAAPGQIVPGPPTTPQPTVPCTPVTGCGRGPGVQRDVAFAWIDRYCNGDAVPTPPGETTFAVNYGLGGQSSGPVQFVGVATMNGAVVPTQPLAVLQPGQKDTRIRTAVVPSGAVFEVAITGTVTAGPNAGQPVIFGNGTDTRIRMASGDCPTATPLIPTPGIPGLPPPLPPFPGGPNASEPPVTPQSPTPVNTVPGTGTIVQSR